ncbi:hypothetical protein V2A60_009662 [Cordyceps javanica]
MAVPPSMIAAIQADLGRARQEELPLSNVAERGRSFAPPRADESRNYDARIKKDLNNRWSAAIVDEESKQMEGLTNLNARPWASSGIQQPSRFVTPKAPLPVVAQQAASPPAASPALASPKPAPSVSKTRSENQTVYGGRCEVSLHEGQVVVPDARFRVDIAANQDEASLTLTAPGKSTMVMSVLDLEVPIIYGTCCIIKTKPLPEAEAVVYKIKPLDPSTADKLCRVLESLQTVICKRLGRTLPLKLPSIPSTPPRPKIAPRQTAPVVYSQTPLSKSLICADSPESSPESSPRLTYRQLIEVTPQKQSIDAPVKLDEVIDKIGVIVRTAYYQITGRSIPMPPTASSTEQHDDVAMAEWLTKGTLDSDVDETKRSLVEIMRFLRELQLKKAAALERPMMSDQTMEVFKTIDRGIKSQSGAVNYSASEIMDLKKAAIVPPAMDIKKGLSSSLWAKK